MVGFFSVFKFYRLCFFREDIIAVTDKIDRRKSSARNETGSGATVNVDDMQPLRSASCPRILDKDFHGIGNSADIGDYSTVRIFVVATVGFSGEEVIVEDVKIM